MEEVANYPSPFPFKETESNMFLTLAHSTLSIVQYSETVIPKADFQGKPQDS